MHKGEAETEDVFVHDCKGPLQLGHPKSQTKQIADVSSENFPGGHWFTHYLLSFPLISKYRPLAHVKYS